MTKEHKKIYKQIAQTLKKTNRIALFTHISPDLDALGSMYGLYEALIDMQKHVDMFVKDPFNLSQKTIFDETLVSKEDCDASMYDCLICLDASTAERLGSYGTIFVSHPNTIKIDHHYFGDDLQLAKFNLIEGITGSCCEIVLKLLQFMHLPISSKTATYLYAGLSSDTGSFINSNTSRDSFLAAAALCDLGADVLFVNNASYRLVTKQEIAIQQTFYQNIEIIDDTVAISTISQKELHDANASKSDCDSFSSKLNSIAGVKIACTIVEKMLRVFQCSMRAKDGYDVSLICQIFGGGGHKVAAGCIIHANSMAEAKSLMVNEIKNYLINKSNNVNEKG